MYRHKWTIYVFVCWCCSFLHIFFTLFTFFSLSLSSHSLCVCCALPNDGRKEVAEADKIIFFTHRIRLLHAGSITEIDILYFYCKTIFQWFFFFQCAWHSSGIFVFIHIHSTPLHSITSLFFSLSLSFYHNYFILSQSALHSEIIPFRVQKLYILFISCPCVTISYFTNMRGKYSWLTWEFLEDNFFMCSTIFPLHAIIDYLPCLLYFCLSPRFTLNYIFLNIYLYIVQIIQKSVFFFIRRRTIWIRCIIFLFLISFILLMYSGQVQTSFSWHFPYHMEWPDFSFALLCV